MNSQGVKRRVAAIFQGGNGGSSFFIFFFCTCPPTPVLPGVTRGSSPIVILYHVLTPGDHISITAYERYYPDNST